MEEKNLIIAIEEDKGCKIIFKKSSFMSSQQIYCVFIKKIFKIFYIPQFLKNTP